MIQPCFWIHSHKDRAGTSSRRTEESDCWSRIPPWVAAEIEQEPAMYAANLAFFAFCASNPAIASLQRLHNDNGTMQVSMQLLPAAATTRSSRPGVPLRHMATTGLQEQLEREIALKEHLSKAWESYHSSSPDHIMWRISITNNQGMYSSYTPCGPPSPHRFDQFWMIALGAHYQIHLRNPIVVSLIASGLAFSRCPPLNG